ncbi:MAG: arabinosyltransferase domain-containing protein [Gaiellaceae bacterium]
MTGSRLYWRRGRLPLVVAGVALLCALIGALGPAKHLRAQYSWPPRELPAGNPAGLWYTPLLLSRHEPGSISAQIPCSPPPALSRSNDPIVVFATQRDWTATGGLAVTRNGKQLRVEVGGSTLATVPVALGEAGCAYRLDVAGGRWSLDGGSPSVSLGGGLDQMPTVVGLFSSVDLRSGTGPTVEVTTAVYGADTTLRQAVLWVLATIGALAALILATRARVRARTRAKEALRRPVLTRILPDVVVAFVLIGWWLIGPAFFDDGWVAARQKNFSAAHGFSAYYTSFGVNLPLGYWLEWLEHWLVDRTNALLLLRLPAFVALCATWVLCRWILRRCVRSSASERIAVWTLVCAFAVGATAWGMTLRPEPVVAVLVTGVLACIVRFLESEDATAVALAAVLVVLALAAHPAGIVSIAPLIAAAPALVTWARRRFDVAGTIVVGASTLLVVLATVGSDLAQRRADVSSLRRFGDETAGWRDELSRYTFLNQAPYGASLRRESVALIGLAVLAYILRRRRADEDRLLALPATSLCVALVVLLLTPTKWPWHFGTLIGIAALAVAAETARLREHGRGTRTWDARPFIAVGAAVTAAAWSWSPRLAWGDLDLRTLHWTLGVERTLTFSKLAGAVPVVFLAALAAFAVARGRSERLREVPWLAAAWTATVIAVPLVAFTALVLVADSAKTHSWTLARQNVRTLRGDIDCGLADDALVPVAASMRALAPLASARLPAAAAWLPPTPERGLPRFALEPPAVTMLSARSPWFALPSGHSIGFFVTAPQDSTAKLELEWGRAHGSRVERLGAEGVSTDFANDAQPGGRLYWRFDAAGDLPSPPPGATAVRFAVHSDVEPAVPIGLTPPVTYVNETLARLLRRDKPAVVVPNLLTYVPCANQPRVSGVAEVPKLLIAFRTSLWPLSTDTSPFEDVPQLYDVVRLSLADSKDPPGDVAVYEVNRQIEGAVVAAPVATTTR